MADFVERLEHYDEKCRQHLSRVRLSHVLALGALSGEQARSDEKLDLIRASFGNEMQDRFEMKVRTVIHELHLVSLKTNFELFLDRLLWAVWMFHLPDLAATVSGNVSLSELAEAFVHTTDSSGDVRDFIINKIVPAYGLRQFEKALEKATGINLSHVLNHKDIRYWPQICTAFEVRHLVEHRDGRVDRKFRKDLAPFWGQSSWGRRDSLERLKKVPVEEEDVFETYTTMFEATGLITAEVLHWNSGVPR